MRDLFQVVFELKKKEIELAKQHIEQSAINAIKFHAGGIFVEPAPDTKVNLISQNNFSSRNSFKNVVKFVYIV